MRQLLVVIVAAAFVIYSINVYMPIQQRWKTISTVVIIGIVCLLLLRLVGLFRSFPLH